MENTYNILDIHLMSNNYVVLFSGLDISPIKPVTKELCEIFNATILDYTHLDFDSDLQVVNDRVRQIIGKPGTVLFIKGKSFDRQKVKFHTDLHINLSVNNALINDDELATKYKKIIATNYINKYFNFKQDTVITEYIDNIFMYIIDDIEKKVYKDKYDKLNHKVYDANVATDVVTDVATASEDKPITSRLISNPDAKSPEELNEHALQVVKDDFDDETSTPSSSDSIDDYMHDEVLFEPR